MTTEINFTCQCLVEDYCNIQGYCNPNWLSRWFEHWASETVGFSSSALLFPKYVISFIPHRKSRVLTKAPPEVPKLEESEIEWGKVNNTFTISLRGDHRYLGACMHSVRLSEIGGKGSEEESRVRNHFQLIV